MNIQDRYGRLLARRTPDEDRVVVKMAEPFQDARGEASRYLLGAMRAVEEKYTEKLVEQGNRVERQLSRRLSSYPRLEFHRQGSVSNGTHIRFYSDVDVLAIIDRFYVLEPPQVAVVPFEGDPNQELLYLRRDIAQELRLAFPAVELDDTGATAVKLQKSASLACSVDVVPANWYDSVRYSEHRIPTERGIQVLNRKANERKLNFPFLYNERLRERDESLGGVPKMQIRLLKSLKADLEEEGASCSFSSFDIGSIVYRTQTTWLNPQGPLEIARGLQHDLLDVLRSPSRIRELKTVDDSRLIFDKPEKVDGALALYRQLAHITAEASREHVGGTFSSVAHL